MCDALRQTPDFVYSVSCTTRPPRAGEIEGEDYHFLSEAEFRRAADRRRIPRTREGARSIITARCASRLLTNLQNGVDVLIDIDTQGAAAIRNYDDAIRPAALCDVFIMPPDLDELRRRLTKRGTETPEQIELRLVNAAREMELWRDYRYTIISQSMEEDLQKFRHIMGAERYLSSRMILA